MQENEHDTGQRGWLLIVALVLLPVLYLAALGPLHGLAVNGYIPRIGYRVLKVAYYPLERLNEDTDFFDSHPVGRTYVAYVEWFD